MLYSTVLAVTVATMGVVEAQVGSPFQHYPLSDNCKRSILALFPVVPCIDMAGLFEVIGLPLEQDWLDPASQWLEKACTLKDCDPDTLTTAATGVLDACQPDLDLIGYGNARQYLTPKTIPLYFKSGKNALCTLDQSNKSSLCVRDLALKIQKIYGITYQPKEASKSVNNVIFFGKDKNNNYPAEIVCDQCSLGIYNQFKEAAIAVFPTLTRVEGHWDAQCGANFTSTEPKNIAVQLAQNDPPANTTLMIKNGASSVPQQTGFARMALMIVAGVVFFNA